MKLFDKYLITSHHLRVYKSSKVLRVNRLNNARSTRETYPLNNVNIGQPRPQGFSLKKWVGRDFCIIYSYKNFLHMNLDFLSFQLRNHVNIIYYYHLLYSSIAYTKLAI